MLNAEWRGRSYDAGKRRIEAAAVRAFAEAVGDTNPAYRSAAVPPAYAAVYCLRPAVQALFADPEVNLDLGHLVHGEQHYRFHRSPRIGEEVHTRGRISGIGAKRNLDFLTFETEAVDVSHAPICSSVSLFIIRNP